MDEVIAYTTQKTDTQLKKMQNEVEELPQGVEVKMENLRGPCK
jgi:hypothetical protein